jgi:hypothetical protein
MVEMVVVVVVVVAPVDLVFGTTIRKPRRRRSTFSEPRRLVTSPTVRRTFDSRTGGSEFENGVTNISHAKKEILHGNPSAWRAEIEFLSSQIIVL